VSSAAQATTTETILTLPANTTIKARVRQGTIWSALIEATFSLDPDLDDDGIDDVWESAHGMSASDPADAALDTDGDGATAREEFLAGTDPRAAASVLRLHAEAADPSNGRLVLLFPLEPGRVYVIEQSSSMEGSSAWSVLESFGPEMTARPVQHTVSPGPAPRFYRLRVRPAP
jgi:hypothetical protein